MKSFEILKVCYKSIQIMIWKSWWWKVF